jgi:glycine/D-amino acid oxidase-like deaminating enzyme
MQEKSTWERSKKKLNFPKLKESMQADVTIIGGGLAGISTAYLLSKAGLKVVVLEQNEIGTGVTMYTTAFLTHLIDTDLTVLKKIFGTRKAKIIWESHAEAIDKYQDIIRKEKIDCEFLRCPYYAYANNIKEYEGVPEEVLAANKIGFKNVSLTYPKDLPFDNFGGMVALKQAKFNPMEYIYALAKKAKANGAMIFENSEVKKIKGKSPFLVTTKEGEVKAQYVVIATYAPIENTKTSFKKGMYKSYEIEAEIPKRYLKEALYQDLHNPYHYFRIDLGKTKDRIIIGGEDHRKELKIKPEKNYRALEIYLRHILKGKPYKIITKWSGPILEPSDGIALIGEIEPKKFVATAFSGTGMTYAMISAILISDKILKKKNPWIAVYDPKRKLTLKLLVTKGKEYTGELIGGAVKNTFKN